MITGPKTSWKTSSKRRSRPGSFNAGENKQNAAKKYEQQLNPYKSTLRDSNNSHNSPHGNSATRGVTDDQDNFPLGDDDNIDLGASDEEGFGIDDILKDINNDDDKIELKPRASMHSGGNEKKAGLGSPIASEYMTKGKRADTKNAVGKSPTITVSSVDFGSKREREFTRVTGRENKGLRDNEQNIRDLGNSIEEDIDNDTLLNDSLSEGDATKEHKLMVQNGQTPMFSSGGFDGDNKSRPRSSNLSSPSLGRSGSPQPPTRRKSNLVEELLDDIDNDYNNLLFDKSDGTISSSTPDSTERAMRSLVNDYASNMDKNSSVPQSEGKLSSSTPDDASEANSQSLQEAHTKSPPAKSVQKGSIKEDETLSEVTDPTESPFIYTYKRDDDEVSQITSSLAGHSMGSSQLQSVSNSLGSNPGRNNNNGPTWMSGAGAGNRMAYRKPTGMYGRDRGRKSVKVSKTASGGSSGSLMGGSFDGSGGGGGGGGDNSALDEIAYALNADTSSGRNQRARRPQGRATSGMFLDEGPRDGLSTIESQSTGYISKPYSIDVKSNVSKLGMGGISCSESVAGTSVTSESSKSTFEALFQNLSSFFFKAQHHAGRFFFPTSAAVTRRKKFDRSDSLEDILLEEGSKTSSNVKRTSRNSYDEDEIDYFSKAMGKSSASQSYSPSAKRPKRKKKWWQRTTARMGGAFLLMTMIITIFKMPSKEGRVQYDPSRHGQVFDYATNALIDVSDVPKSRNSPDQSRPVQVEVVLQDTTPQLPMPFQALANVDSGPFQRGIDVPFYWHVPRTGGGTVNDILGSCLHLTLAADAGGSEGPSEVEMLKVLHFSHEVNYVNVDTSTLKGIQRAQDLNLVPSGLADVVISPLLHDATSLFTPTRKGRLFTILRDPIERAASLFYFIQDTQWKQPDSRNEQFASMSIEEFYEGGFAENNWMTRFLTNELTKGELTEEDLNVAKEVLRQKCLIGLLEQKGETFDRFQRYFGWRPKNGSEEECLAKKLDWAWPMKHRHPPVEKSSDAYGLIRTQNMFDLQLYDYAKQLFKQQEQLFP